MSRRRNPTAVQAALDRQEAPKEEREGRDDGGQYDEALVLAFIPAGVL